ncbi:phosphoglycerate dehydrogenase-like enzyme [Kribbella aluminosa]|uniref:Phosphoglycerate dehydrogenase-like enzyme n=1 Tax=Kribbella aluminosa TaxID=416017 RepID=A0ABS4UTS0_9ACTN|nr:NAD(P)-dependent oxidoreductase [Kribbella aluminosa]MBP2355039.1 phosphoglycerate dehydrogenase-like enzyme [Kribbella aluminosa]
MSRTPPAPEVRAQARKTVGIAGTPASWERYVASASVERLRRVADVSWLPYDGADRGSGPPPSDGEAVGRLHEFVTGLDALVVGYGCPRVTAGVLAAGKRLVVVGDTHGDRFAERIDVAAARDAGVLVVDTTNGSSDPVAEWALALILIGLRNAGAHFRRLIGGEVLWPDRTVFQADPGYLRGELAGKTVGLVAAGLIGRRLIELLRPFGVHVLVSDPGVPDLLAGTYDLDLTDLDTVMARSEVVVCLAPLTAATKGLIGADQIRAMRPGTVFVNVSRGAVVDSEALVERLATGDLIACLDVFDPEPLPADSPLRAMGNVFLSPHIAGVTAAAEPRFFDLMVDELERVFAGYRPRFPLVPRNG